MDAARSADDLFAQLERLRGRNDSVSASASIDLLAHSLQCAQALDAECADDELIVAGLLHDIGHGIRPGEKASHGATGAHFVRHVLGERVARLIELHVPAKAYLVAADPTYGAVLSPGSAASLELQGGALVGEAFARFEADPLSDAAIRLRRCDEGAKVAGARTPDLAHWAPLVRALASRSG